MKGGGSEKAPERPVAMPDDVQRIVGAIDEQYKVMVLLGANCSLRFGELAGLKRRRVDLLHRTIAIEEQAVELAGGKMEFGPPKTEAGRRKVAVPAELIPAIEAHLAAFVGTDPDSLVFTSPQGHPLRRRKFRLRWLAACAAANMTGLHFHDLRGSGATWAGHQGATVAELIARLGHTTPSMAMHYQGATAERDQAIAVRLGALLSAAAELEPVAAVSTIG